MPGPSNMPDRVLRAMHRAGPDIYGGPLIDLTETVLRDLRRLAGTDGACAIYIGNGHAVWEASVANILAPGDKALFAVNGQFGHGCGEIGKQPPQGHQGGEVIHASAIGRHGAFRQKE